VFQAIGDAAASALKPIFVFR